MLAHRPARQLLPRAAPGAKPDRGSSMLRQAIRAHRRSSAVIVRLLPATSPPRSRRRHGGKRPCEQAHVLRRMVLPDSYGLEGPGKRAVSHKRTRPAVSTRQLAPDGVSLFSPRIPSPQSSCDPPDLFPPIGNKKTGPAPIGAFGRLHHSLVSAPWCPNRVRASSLPRAGSDLHSHHTH